MTEGEGGAALQLGADSRLCRGYRKTRTLMLDLRLDRQQLAGAHEAAHLGFLHHCEKRHPLEVRDAKHEPAGTLRHRFGQQDAGHDWKAGKMPLEDRVGLRNLRLDRNGPLAEIEVDDAIDKLEIFELHGS